MVLDGFIESHRICGIMRAMAAKRTAGIILTASFIALTLCGAGLLVVQMEHGAHVAGCPFSGSMDASCPLSTVERLSTFATTLGTLPVALFSFLVLLALSAMSASVVPVVRAVLPHKQDRARSEDAALWHPLQPAFARGILNPKPF